MADAAIRSFLSMEGFCGPDDASCTTLSENMYVFLLVPLTLHRMTQATTRLTTVIRNISVFTANCA